MIRAQVRGDLEAQRRDRAVALRGDLDVVDLIAAVDHRLEALRARLDVLDRAFELHRNPAQDGLFGIDVELGAETAADFRGDRPNLVLRQPEHHRELRAQQMRNLGSGVDRELLHPGVVVRDDRARLDRYRRHALVDDALLDRHVGLGESLVGVTGGERHGEGDVGPQRRVDVRRPRRRLLRIDHRRQLFVLDGDQLGGVDQLDLAGRGGRHLVLGDENDPARQLWCHRRRPLSFDFLISPSYWWASR